MKTLMLTMLILTGYLWADSADAAEGAFFVTGTVEYQLDSLTDPLIRTGCHMSGPTRICTGKNPLAEFKIGYEFAFGDWRNHWWIPVFQTGWKHESHWFQGQPFNDEPETHAEKLFLEFRFGGLR